MSPEITIELLRRWSHLLLWVSIVLPLLGGLAAGARYYVERRERTLSGSITQGAIRRAQDEASGYIVVISHGETDKSALANLVGAFEAARISVRTDAVAENSISMWYPDTIHIVVGRKAQQ